MKKLLSLILIVLSIFLISCNKNGSEEINVYMPDGAPALVFSKMMCDDNFKEYKFHVVGSSEIGNYVANKQADIILLPINLASKLAGDEYKLVSVNTHGNLYLITKTGEKITDLNNLKGKKIGVVNLTNIPGLTLKALLNKNGIEYTEKLEEINGKVFLENIDSGEVPSKLNNNLDDYTLVPEPQKSKILSQVAAFSESANIQTLWGFDSYPQAVMLVKSSLCKEEMLTKIKNCLDGTTSWLKENQELAVSKISENSVGGKSSLNASVLTSQAIDGSNIKFVWAIDMKQTINSYISGIIEVNSQSAKVINDNFYYEK